MTLLLAYSNYYLGTLSTLTNLFERGRNYARKKDFGQLQGMITSMDQSMRVEEMDSIDAYFECITSCSIDEDGSDCINKCLEVHLKPNLDWLFLEFDV